MKEQPIFDERILEALEVCRPGSDDANDPALDFLADELARNPELRLLHEQLQQIDATLSACFADVPVPEGLQERLLAHLAEATPEVQPRSNVSRRRWMLAAGSLVGAAAVWFAALWLGQPASYSEQDALNEAIRLFSAEAQQPPEPGNLLAQLDPPSTFGPSRFVAKGLRGVRWRRMGGFLGRRGVAYDMDQGGVRAVLYVVDHRGISGLRAGSPPSKPRYNTAGCATSAWREGRRMYVLVVRGNARAYRGFLSRRGPLT